MTGDVIGLLVGLVLLTFAADRLVVSAARIGKVSGLSPILIGAVVVGLGTSLPEMLVSGLDQEKWVWDFWSNTLRINGSDEGQTTNTILRIPRAATAER
jgi:hypothetical protein